MGSPWRHGSKGIMKFPGCKRINLHICLGKFKEKRNHCALREGHPNLPFRMHSMEYTKVQETLLWMSQDPSPLAGPW